MTGHNSEEVCSKYLDPAHLASKSVSYICQSCEAIGFANYLITLDDLTCGNATHNVHVTFLTYSI